MAEDQASAAGDQGSGQDDNDDDDSSGAPPEGNGSLSLDQLQQELKATRAEAAKHRKALRAAQEKLTAAEEGTLSEQQKLQRRVEELETSVKERDTRLQQMTLRQDVSVEATKLGFLNPGLAHKVLEADEIEYDDDGAPTNLERLLKRVLKENPYLATSGGRGGGADGGAGRGSGSSFQNDINRQIREAAGRT